MAQAVTFLSAATPSLSTAVRTRGLVHGKPELLYRGEGWRELGPLVAYRGLAILTKVYVSHFEGRNTGVGPVGFESPLVGYRAV